MCLSSRRLLLREVALREAALHVEAAPHAVVLRLEVALLLEAVVPHAVALRREVEVLPPRLLLPRDLRQQLRLWHHELLLHLQPLDPAFHLLLDEVVVPHPLRTISAPSRPTAYRYLPAWPFCRFPLCLVLFVPFAVCG